MACKVLPSTQFEVEAFLTYKCHWIVFDLGLSTLPNDGIATLQMVYYKNL